MANDGIDYAIEPAADEFYRHIPDILECFHVLEATVFHSGPITAHSEYLRANMQPLMCRAQAP